LEGTIGLASVMLVLALTLFDAELIAQDGSTERDTRSALHKRVFLKGEAACASREAHES
jgi:hypothetical protein